MIELKKVEKQYNVTSIIINQFKSIPYFLYTVEDSYLYISFTNEKIIMMVNLAMLVTEWIYRIESSASQIGKPQIKESTLYVLDSDKTLHIFEKNN